MTENVLNRSPENCCAKAVVTAVDVDISKLSDLASDPAVELLEADLEAGEWPLPGRTFDGIVVTHGTDTMEDTARLLGRNILDQPGFDFDIEIHMGAGAYICGEESALIESLEGKRGIPRDRPPFPVTCGYKNKPTALNNVETFVAAAKIAEFGADWYQSVGTPQSSGTKLLSISGDCDRPGIYEYPFGTSIRQILEDCGAKDAQAVQVAGAAGNLVVPLPPSAIDPDQVEQLGAALRRQLGPPGQRYWALLLGGDGAGYRYTQADWLCLAALVNSLARRHDIRWLLVSSRRTGRRAEALLKGHVDAACVAHACWYRDRDEYRPEAWLGAAERAFVTEDSMTMLSEAACALRPVHSLRPATAAPAQRYEQALQRFAGQRWLCRHRIAELADRVEALDAQHCQALAASPTQRLADQLRERLGLG